MSGSASDVVLLRLVVAGGFLTQEAADAAERQAREYSQPLRETLQRAGVPPDILHSLEVAARGASSTSSAGAPPPSQVPPASSDVTVLAAAATVLQADSSNVTVVSPSGTNLAPRRVGRLTHIAKYEILGEIGRGGMGVVYKARHPGLDRVVALKTLIHPGSQEHVERFLREARSAARMGKHPGLVQVHDVGEDQGMFYFTMEFVEGQGFDREIHAAGKPPTPRRVAEVAESIARGLAHAHSEGVIHRDLKPSNVLIDFAARPLLTDFGLAKEVGAGSSVSVAGQILGTPAYMSPEQAEGKLDAVNERSDVYGLGCILYEGLALKPPFEAPGSIELLRKVCSTDPVPPSRFRPVPRDLETICLKCLSKSPADRYDSAAALADDLKRFLDGEPILARPVAWSVRLARRIRKNKLVTLLGSAAVIGLIVGGVFAVRFLREREEKERERTRLAGERAAAEEKTRQVEEHARRGREALDRAEHAMRLDVAALAGGEPDRAPLEQAAAHFAQALALDPSHFEARRLRARALRLAGRHPEAISEALRALALRPGDPGALFEKTQSNLTLLRAAMGRLSIANYSNLASLGAQKTRRVYVGVHPSAHALREEVLRDIESLRAGGLSASAAAYFRGVVLSLDEKGNDWEALAAFEEAIAADRYLVEAYRERATLWARVGSDKALGAYRELARALPCDPELLVELAFLEPSPKAALAAADRAVQLAPASADIRFYRGLLHYNANRRAEALKDLEQVIADEPGHAQALWTLFCLAEDTGDYETADAWLARWKPLAPAEPILWWQAGVYHRVTARHAEALPCFERALELDPAYPLYLWARGRSRLVLGQTADGAKDLFDAVASGDMEPTARKLFEGMRSNLEKQIAGLDTPEKVAGMAKNLAALLKFSLGNNASEDRKKQYEASIGTLMYMASELYEKAEKWKEAEESFRAANPPVDGWGTYFVLARFRASRYDKPGAIDHLRRAKLNGMSSLGAVRVDRGFQRLRDADEWKGLEQEWR